MELLKIIGTTITAILFVACGGDSGSSSSATPSSTNGSNGGIVSKVTLTGQVTYDHIPHRITGFGLDYDAMSKQPARGIVVVLLDENNGTVEQTITDDTGHYTFEVDPGKDVKVQARAQLDLPGRWDIRVTDNTMDNALYVMEGSLNSSGMSARQTRNIHAASGWNGSRYSSNRVAAPFAILNPVYDAIQMVQAADPEVKFPDMEYRWSPENRAVAGNKALGQIGTSGYHKDENAVYLLGDADRDTDEYDPHVIIHEWGHYFEDHFSRLDSMGGLHGLDEKLDPRLAFSEGFGNGLSAIVTGDPNYKDSAGPGQANGFAIDFETLTTAQSGWFNEGSVAAIIYDIFDDNRDGNDFISAGFSPIYHAMTDPAVKEADIFATIFSFSDALVAQTQINANDYRLLLGTQNIFSSHAQGAGERNNGAIQSSLPVYKAAEINGDAVTICSVDDAGRFNKLGNREFVYFEVAHSGPYEIDLSLESGNGSHDPDFNIWQAGQLIEKGQSSRINSEEFTGELTEGAYVIEAYEFYNINGNSDRSGDACFAVSVRHL